jgi:hypothetical protein
MAICNDLGSPVTRPACGNFLTNAGPEIGVVKGAREAIGECKLRSACDNAVTISTGTSDSP